jgi:membrane-associated phospholipid phosphatase
MIGRLSREVRPADAVTLFFVALFALLTALFHDSIPSASKLLVTYGILFILQLVLIRLRPEKGLSKIIHDFIFPVSAVLIVYVSLTELITGVTPIDIDYRLIRADYLLLGVYPTVWLEKIVNPYLTEILQLSYTSYYFLPVILGMIVKANRKNAEFDEGLFYILLCFYLSYVGYILFPALGPRYVMNHLQTVPLQGVFLFEWIYNFLNTVEGIKRDAFPSGHTAVTLVVLHLAYLYERKVFYFFLPVVILLLFSTVYCRYHYVVDILAGIALYVVAMVFGRWFFSQWTKR